MDYPLIPLSDKLLLQIDGAYVSRETDDFFRWAFSLFLTESSSGGLEPASGPTTGPSMSLESVPFDLTRMSWAPLLTFTQRENTLHFCLLKKNMKQQSKRVRVWASRAFLWLSVCRRLGPSSCASSGLSVWIYLTDEKKKFPVDPGTPLDAVHANTAFTTSCPKRGEIILYRQEEWFKVLMHESMHLFGLDSSGMSTQPTRIQQHFQLKDTVRVFEAYTEAWATLFHVAFCAWEIGNRTTTTTTTTQNTLLLARHFLQCEITWSQSLREWVLQHYDYGKHPYREKTNVFAYVFLKTLLLQNSNTFLRWCLQHNGPSYVPFTQSTTNQEAFDTFLIKLADDSASPSSLHHMRCMRCMRLTAIELL
jgi:hypothetical protein